MYNKLDFKPLFGWSSPHFQTVFAAFGNNGKEPPSEPLIVTLDDGDKLLCYLSNPSSQNPKKIVVFVHGLGGSHSSGYLVRLSRHVYQAGFCAVRVNLRNCGTQEKLASLPYNGGTSGDVLCVLKLLKKRFPFVPLVLLGFSLGGNIVLKLAGELAEEGKHYIQQLIAVCPTIDLYHSVQYIEKNGHQLYHHYYLSHLLQQSKQWLKNLSIKSIFEFDDKITAPLWGYKSAKDYYQKCSSGPFIKHIAIPTRILFAEDDPFIDCHILDYTRLPPHVNVYVTEHGGHMGFLGWIDKVYKYRWMDYILMQWIISDASSV